MFSRDLQEEAKLDAMQRHWHNRRTASSTYFFEEVNQSEELLSLPFQNRQRTSCVPSQPNQTCEGEGLELQQEHILPLKPQIPKAFFEKTSIQLDASTLGDLPARYTICNLEPHQLPVVGVYIDKRVVPGFKYRVRPLPEVGKNPSANKCLFDDRALTLKSIGRGYARRFTFESATQRENDNYFWSDNRPEGYAFELEAMSEGDKFTFFDADREAQGTVEVVKVEGAQIEISSSLTKDGIEKRANVKFTGKVEYYETRVAKPLHLEGTVVCVKAKGKSAAEIVKVINVSINRHRCYMVPGMQKVHRRFTVRGQDINDVPTKYTMTGLEPFEIPVVGTYVDPRVIPGFYYKVRPNDRKDHLFGGRALKLLSIGQGYAKRLTFQPDSLISPNNYLWSDNHPDGLGLEPRALHKGMKFTVMAGDLVLGEAEVFRADLPQYEEKMEKIDTPKGYAIQKHIYVDVICHIRLARTGGASTENDNYSMRVSGIAVVRKEPRSSEAKVLRVENVGLDSQLLLIFAHMQTKLTLVPKC